MRRDVGCLLVLGLFAAGARAEAPEAFAYAWPITAPQGGKAYLVELPQDAYAWASRDAGLADVVVVDAEGRQVAAGPYTAAAPTSHPVTLDAPLRAVPAAVDGVPGARIQRSTNGDIVIEPGPVAPTATPRVWLFDARSAIAPERLEFAAIDHDVNLGVDVDTSNDLQDWNTRVRGASIVTLGKGDGAVDARVIKLSGSPARYYRVRVMSGEAPWAIDSTSSVTLSGSVEDAAAKDEAKLLWLDVPVGDTKSSGQGVDYDYRLPAALPVNSVRVTLGKSDSVARLDASAVEGTMSSEALGTLVVTPDGTEGRRPLEVNARRRDLLRLHSATPLREAPHLSVGWRPDRFVFLPEGKGPYRLLVGSARERRPAWPVGDAVTALRKSEGAAWRPDETTLGPGQELGGREALSSPAAPFDWTRPLLWVVLLLGAGLIAGMAGSLLRKPKAGGEDEGKGES
ncbi:DUF3999 family protein [Luteibacter sp. 22Crub2.1]|uniref:DUF3999 family protein n=1 Tax=Luteibacter sp. 22Crub2.1 TaxID=1283288 RepID=UPI0009CAB8B7|nr:DUF3999 family protein [Luteibacter sp. 22Crub2.1]SKB28125.1 Protein of unknown function [Luteibacter sp. 22Crub2.1]